MSMCRRCRPTQVIAHIGDVHLSILITPNFNETPNNLCIKHCCAGERRFFVKLLLPTICSVSAPARCRTITTAPADSNQTDARSSCLESLVTCAGGVIAYIVLVAQPSIATNTRFSPKTNATYVCAAINNTFGVCLRT